MASRWAVASRWATGALALSSWAGLLPLSACSQQKAQSKLEDVPESLLDPGACRSCHPGHYDEWAGSMHAYASLDPVFLALNRRGQEETQGRLGSFCVNCHAPLALRAGLTEDGLNLESVPAAYQGVGCYFCHNVSDVEGSHNNPLTLANDRQLLGPFDDPDPTSAHASRYDARLDAEQLGSSELCGACHDVRIPEEFVPGGFDLERTYSEWQGTLFNQPANAGGVTCNGCHMPVSSERESSVAGASARPRRSRRHDFEGIDLALTPFAGATRQRELVEQFLAASLLAELCVSEQGRVRLTLENVGAGHAWPSGAAHDREPWIELKAYVTDGAPPVFETVAPELATGSSSSIVLNHVAVDSAGKPTHMFWEIAGFAESNVLAGVATRDAMDPRHHAERRVWNFETGAALQRVTLLIRMRPIKLALLNDLVQSGHLDPSVAEAMPVLDVLPERCRQGAACDDTTDRAFTLVWSAVAPQVDEPRFRRTTLGGSAATCWAHPSFIVPDAE